MWFQWRKAQCHKSCHETHPHGKHTWSLQPGTYPRRFWLSESRGGSQNPPLFSLKSPTGFADVPFGLGTTTLESLQFQTQTSRTTMCRCLQTQGGIGNWGREEQRNCKNLPTESHRKASSTYATSLSFCCIWVTPQLMHFLLSNQVCTNCYQQILKPY